MNSITNIKEFLSVRFTLGEAADSIQYAPEDSFLALNLIHLLSDSDKQIGFRAAWFLEMLIFQRPILFTPFINEFFKVYFSQKNLSVLRHITKIFMYIQGSKSPEEWKIHLNNFLINEPERLVEIHFEWLININIPVAIRANCIDILFVLGKENPWIYEELKPTLSIIMQEPSPALFSRAKKYIQKLK